MSNLIFDELYEYSKAPITMCSNLVISKRVKSGSGSRCLLIDRDGTLIEHSPYLIEFSKVQFISEIVEVISFANQNSIPVFIVSNQAGVAHNYFSESDLILLNSQILDILFQKHGVYVDGVFSCISHPEPRSNNAGFVCDCRKPRPGLLFAALEECGVIPSMAGMVGDTESDISAAFNAGVKYTWKVSKENRAQVRHDIISWILGEYMDLCI